MFKSFLLFGRFEIFTLPIMIFLAFFLGGFVFYRLIHASARYHEFDVFDALIWSTLGGLIAGRLAHLLLSGSFNSLILSHYTNIPGPNSLDLLHYFDIFHYPGLIIPVALLAGSYFFSLYLKHLKITDLELLDDWSRAVCFMLIIYHLGLFLDGSGYGFLTTSPLGIRFPGLSLPVYPVQLFSLLYYLVIYFLLAYLEQNYRTYDWYRANRSQAKPGFIFFSFLFFATLYQLLLLSFQPAAYHLFGFSLDWIFYLSLLLLDLFLVYRHIHAPTHRSQNPRLKKRSLSKKFSFFSLKKSASAAKKPSKKNPATSAKTPAPTFKAPKTFKNAPKATSSKKVTSA